MTGRLFVGGCEGCATCDRFADGVFTLGGLLSYSTSRLVARHGMDEVHAIADWCCGADGAMGPATLAAFAPKVVADIAAQHPWLAEVGSLPGSPSLEELDGWLRELETFHGDSFALERAR